MGLIVLLSMLRPSACRLRHSAPPRLAVHFRCPTCSEPLLPVDGSLRCSNRHSVDIAKEGYVYLIGPRRVSPEAAAESDALVRASRSFFEGGGFGPQVSAVAEEVVRALSHVPGGDADGESHVLAAGCGEGAVLRTVEQLLPAGGACRLWGTDESKLAVRYAAKRQRANRAS